MNALQSSSKFSRTQKQWRPWKASQMRPFLICHFKNALVVSTKKITIRQTINSLLEIYDLTDHNNDENVDKNEKAHKKTKLYRPREENSQDIFTSIKFSMFGWTEGDEEQSNERDLQKV